MRPTATQPAAVAAPAGPATSGLDATHVARFDAAIAPARDYAVTAALATLIKDAAAAVNAGDLSKAAQLREQVTDPVGRKLVDWLRLRAGYGDAGEYRAFLDQNPMWPDRLLLTQRLEEALFTQGGSARSIKEQFAAEQPKTAAGWAALASAHLADGDKTRAKAFAVRAWREPGLGATLETGFLTRFGTLLSEADHKWRFDRLVVDDVRWANDRAEKVPVAKRVVPLLSKPEQQKAEARLAVYQRAGNASQLLAALPDDAKTDWGLVYHRAQQLRRSNKNEEAWKLLLSAPSDPALLVNPDEWWEERRVNLYEALEEGKAQTAYDLARDGSSLGANAANDQALLAGWIALRHLKNAKLAEKHFLDMRKSADGPISKGKVDYWLGRTLETLGDKARADTHYKAAAAHVDTFHGQLAREKLEPAERRIVLAYPASPTPEEVQKFNALDAVKAAVLARQSGLEAAVVRAFFGHLARTYKSEAEVAMVAHLAEAIGDTQLALRIGKLAIGRGMNMFVYAYPVHGLPVYNPLRKPPETALLLGIARQESEFNSLTVSGAGAKGILQVMTITAQHVCRDYKVKCDIPRLLSDPAYNTMMGSAYIADRMDEFGGSYVLTFSGFNAGPGRTRQWIGKFGDPRDPTMDVVDWIYRIPFEETREYVQKVMSNVQVYRARLGGGTDALQVGKDLNRARGTASARPPGAAGNQALDAERPAGIVPKKIWDESRG